MEGEEDVAHDELGERLATVAMVGTAKGTNGTRVSLMAWHRWLGHPSFKTVVALAESGADGMAITDLPTKTPGLDACCSKVSTPTAQGRTKSCGSIPGSCSY